MLTEEILIVNDGSLLLKMMGNLLESKGYQVSLTDSPEEALMWLSTRNIVLAVMKLNGRQDDRLAVMHMVKELNDGTRLVVMGESTHLPAEIFETDADDYILLPCRAAEVWRRLLSSLETAPAAQPAPPQAPEVEDEMVHPVNRRIFSNLGLMFHELRSHLNSITTGMEVLRSKTDGRFEADIDNIFQEVISKSRLLIGTADEFLEKFQGRRAVPESPPLVDLREDVVGPILEEFKGDLQKNHIDLDNRLSLLPPTQQVVRGDRVTLKSVFRHLMGNAIHHGGYGCSICLEVDEAPSHFRLRVQNNGDSLASRPPRQMFTAAEDGGGNGHGDGLGFSLGREAIQSQGGDILVDSCQQGSRFIMTLPRA